MSFPRVSTLSSLDKLEQRLQELEVRLPVEADLSDTAQLRLAAPLATAAGTVGNRFCILPMEGWDGTPDGFPSELTQLRWENFGRSGAKLIWGGEAVAVRPDGRANPNQLLLNDDTVASIADLRDRLIRVHEESFGDSRDLSIGLQLTHSGRYARPTPEGPAPRIGYRHPVLDQRVGVNSDDPLLSDDELRRLIEDFVSAAQLAQQAGYSWVDIKHCHGYLGHELLSGFDRPGSFGGSFENRTRFLREIVAGIKAEAPGLGFGVRVSIFDFCPYAPDAQQNSLGTPCADAPYAYAFGGDGSGQGLNLAEPTEFLQLLHSLGTDLVCTTAGSPYYNPHIQRPALFPPSDGYQPPEDPFVGVARQIYATAAVKEACPEMVVVGSGYSYLQEWLPHVGEGVLRAGMADSIGLGRMVLSYPDLPADVLNGMPLKRKRICRTFSDCTTAPRNGMVSGCYPLDPVYKQRPERQQLVELKKQA